MRLLAYADLQATDGTQGCYHNPSLSLQTWRVERFFDKIHKIFEDHRCDGLLDLGDTTDDRTSIPISTIDAICRGFDRFPRKYNWKLIGNHEMVYKESSLNVGRLFSPFFHVVDDVEEIQLKDCKLVCASYPMDQAKTQRWLESRTDRKRSICLGHLQVIGARMSSGISLGGISQGALDGFKLVLLGHVHRTQSLTPTIHYVGSPFQQDFGEAEDNKRVGIVDTEKFSVTWVPMDGFPTYRTVDLRSFLELASNDSEDRFEVVLKSHEEAEKFYANELSSRVSKIHYSFETQTDELPLLGESPQSTTIEDTLKRWLKKKPPKMAGIDIDDQDMLEYGMQISDATN